MMKSACELLGYKVGDKFRVVKDICGGGNNILPRDSVVSLHTDDGTNCLRFITTNGDPWWVNLEDVKKCNVISPGVTVYPEPTNKYSRNIYGVNIDVYDVLKAWDVTCPATQHAIKKLLMPGQRGHKNKLNDLEEAHNAIQRAIELEAF